MKINNKKPGSLLLEILIVIGVVGIVIPIIAQIVVSSLNVNKWSMENKIATDLADETTKSLDSISFEKWQNIYGKVKSSTDHYYTAKVAGAWTINTGNEALTVNTLSYTRYFTISNVCRDNTSREIIMDANIPPCTAGNSDDPSTQKITVTVSWKNGTISKDYYLTRWRNQICNQTSWSGVGSGPVTCPNTTYESATSIDTSSIPGSLKLQAN